MTPPEPCLNPAPAGDPAPAGPPAVDPLARLRHDLRTPAAHILGYAELLQEQVAELGLEHFRPDLARIEAAGRQLLELIREQLVPERLPTDAEALRSLHAALRTPLNHVLGYTDLLLEQAETGPAMALASDLQKIHRAAREFLRLTEEQLTAARLQQAHAAQPAVVSRLEPVALALARPVVLPAASTPVTARILVVDDDPGHRELLSRRLEQQGFTVCTAEGGAEALERLRHESFDLLLLDVLMPDMDGSQVLAALKAESAWRDLPVIVLSALDEQDSVVRCLLAGAEDYLAKPVNTVLLRARLSACLEKNRLRRQEAAYLAALRAEQQKSESLLLNILPAPIADRLKRGETTIVDRLAEVTVLFADLVDFTALAAQLESVAVVRLLDDLFSAFDDLARAQGLEKIKTIGDAYMVVGGVPLPRPDHTEAVAELALTMMDHVAHMPPRGVPPLRLRVGIHTGPVIAGIIGRHKFNYDLWGATVNLASRMESHSLPGRIQVTATTRQRLADRYLFEPRGPIEVKGMGRVNTWFLTGRRVRSLLQAGPEGHGRAPSPP